MPSRAISIGLCAFLCWLAHAAPAWGQKFDQLLERGINLQASGRHEEALAAYEAALRIANPNDINYDILCSNLGQMYESRGQFDRAEAMLKQVLARRQARGNPNDEPIGKTLLNLSVLYERTGRYNEAIGALERANQIFSRHYQIEEFRRLTTVESLANNYVLLGQPGRSYELLSKTLTQLEARVGPNDERLHSILVQLSSAAVWQGQYREADQLIERARRLPAPKDSQDRDGLIANSLCDLYHRMGRYTEAYEQAKLSEQSLLAWVKQHPQDQHMIYLHWGSEGEILLELGQLDEAARLLSTSLEAREKLHQVTPVSTIGNLATAYQRLGQLDKAEYYYRRVIERKDPFPGNRAVARVRLASILVERGKTLEPEQLLRDALSHWEQHEMFGSPHCAENRRVLGELYLANDSAAEAEVQFRQAIEVLEKAEGQHFEELAANWINLARLYERQGKLADAWQAADKSRRVLHELTVKVLPVLPEPQQLQFLAHQDEPALQKALALVRTHSQDPQAIELSATWILNRKGLAQQAVAERMLLAREAQDPTLAKLVDDWMAVRHQLAMVGAASSTGPIGENKQRLLDDLTGREQELARQLGRAKVRQAEPTPWYDLAQFRAALPKASIYVEVVRHTPAGPDDQAVYLAWLVPPTEKGKVQLVDLGSAAEIDEAVGMLRRLLNEIPSRLRGKRGLSAIDDSQQDQDQQQFRRSLDRLGRLLLQPILPTLAKCEHWIICPDGAPWLVPWSALPLAADKDGRPHYVVEKHRVSFTTSGRDLLEKPSPVSGNSALVLADPDFDHAPSDLAASSSPAPESLLARGLVTRSADAVPGNWPPLPGTAQESHLMAPALAAYTKREPQMLLQAQATEAAFKAAWRPRVAVLSTHGYFLSPPATGSAGRVGPQNPLLRCGLVLSGANQPALRAQQDQDDGIVTGLDVLETDLRGTELVVLSACETGVGQVNAGEGVAGLRQAFQLAGARSVAATLWRIPDEETAQLMQTFFDKLAAGADKATALQQAQQSLLASRSKTAQSTSHPFYWAAFTITGDWRVPEVGPVVARPERPVPVVQVEVVAQSAQVMDAIGGKSVLKRVSRGDRLTRGKTSGEWIQVFYEPRSKKSGWIRQSEVQIAP